MLLYVLQVEEVAKGSSSNVLVGWSAREWQSWNLHTSRFQTFLLSQKLLGWWVFLYVDAFCYFTDFLSDVGIVLESLFCKWMKYIFPGHRVLSDSSQNVAAPQIPNILDIVPVIHEVGFFSECSSM